MGWHASIAIEFLCGSTAARQYVHPTHGRLVPVDCVLPRGTGKVTVGCAPVKKSSMSSIREAAAHRPMRKDRECRSSRVEYQAQWPAGIRWHRDGHNRSMKDWPSGKVAYGDHLQAVAIVRVRQVSGRVQSNLPILIVDQQIKLVEEVLP